MSTVVRRNIELLNDVRRREESRKTVSDRIADAVTTFAGSMWCVYAHAVFFGLWIGLNLERVRILPHWDPYPFVMLAMSASVEAIFLSTFILISQNRMQKLADRRAELDVQVGLLTEHELTQAIKLLDEISRRLQTPRPPEHELEEIKQDINPERVVSEIEKAEQQLQATDEDRRPAS
ncbi:MAG TPA: DUF1003 domain-containing protein [Tepidisphaeraceae bacterium]